MGPWLISYQEALVGSQGHWLAPSGATASGVSETMHVIMRVIIAKEVLIVD